MYDPGKDQPRKKRGRWGFGPCLKQHYFSEMPVRSRGVRAGSGWVSVPGMAGANTRTSPALRRSERGKNTTNPVPSDRHHVRVPRPRSVHRGAPLCLTQGFGTQASTVRTVIERPHPPLIRRQPVSSVRLRGGGSNTSDPDSLFLTTSAITGGYAREESLRGLYEDPHHEECASAGEPTPRRSAPTNPLVASLRTGNRCCLPRLSLLARGLHILSRVVDVYRLQVGVRHTHLPREVTVGAAGYLHSPRLLIRCICLHHSTFPAMGVLRCHGAPRRDWPCANPSLVTGSSSEEIPQPVHHPDDWVRRRPDTLKG